MKNEYICDMSCLLPILNYSKLSDLKIKGHIVITEPQEEELKNTIKDKILNYSQKERIYSRPDLFRIDKINVKEKSLKKISQKIFDFSRSVITEPIFIETREYIKQFKKKGKYFKKITLVMSDEERHLYNVIYHNFKTKDKDKDLTISRNEYKKYFELSFADFSLILCDPSFQLIRISIDKKLRTLIIYLKIKHGTLFAVPYYSVHFFDENPMDTLTSLTHFANMILEYEHFNSTDISKSSLHYDIMYEGTKALNYCLFKTIEFLDKFSSFDSKFEVIQKLREIESTSPCPTQGDFTESLAKLIKTVENVSNYITDIIVQSKLELQIKAVYD